MKVLPLIITIIVLAVPAHAYKPEPFSTEDYTLVSSFLVLEIIDWGQTRDIQNHAELHETNIVMGRHPDHNKIDKYFAVAVPACVLIAYVLPTDFKGINLRRLWLSGAIGLEIGCVANNRSHGLKIELPF